MAGDAGADGGGAQVDFAGSARLARIRCAMSSSQHHGVGGEFLAQGHGHGILQLGAADFQQAGKFFGLGGKVSRRWAMAASRRLMA